MFGPDSPHDKRYAISRLLPAHLLLKMWRTSGTLPCLQPSLFQGLATPWTSCLHLTLSSEYMSVLSNVYPVHWRMLSIHVVFSLSLCEIPMLFIALSASPNSLTSFSRYVNFLAFTDSKRFLATPALFGTSPEQAVQNLVTLNFNLLTLRRQCCGWFMFQTQPTGRARFV